MSITFGSEWGIEMCPDIVHAVELLVDSIFRLFVLTIFDMRGPFTLLKVNSKSETKKCETT